MVDASFYEGREQTYIKHVMLQRYLQALAYKIGWWCPTLNYVDCFAGPWQNTDEDLSDTSPGIAIDELRKVRQRLSELGRPFDPRCLFIEKSAQAHDILASRIAEIEDVRATALNGEFEEQVSAISQFCDQQPGDHFDFFFIDPLGWKGFSMDVIGPLLRRQRSEVLINFMTGHISRFVGSDNLPSAEQKNFRSLFGRDNARDAWDGLEGATRERKIVETYAERVSEVGGFNYVATSVILNPLKDRTQFHLIYATRHPEGLRVFRDAERNAIKEQRQSRHDAQGRHELATSGQMGLFEQPYTRSYLDELDDDADQKMDAVLRERLRGVEDVSFEDLELAGLRLPLVHTQRVKDWLKAQEKSGQVQFLNMGKHRVPQPNKGHRIRWTGTRRS